MKYESLVVEYVSLNESAMKKVVEHIDDKWKSKKCSLCDTNTWVMPKDILLSSFVAVICKECGNTILINLKVVGIEIK